MVGRLWGAAGAIGGKLSQLGLDQLVVKDILRALEPGRATLFLLSDYADADAARWRFAHNTPTVLRTTLWRARSRVPPKRWCSAFDIEASSILVAVENP